MISIVALEVVKEYVCHTIGFAIVAHHCVHLDGIESTVERVSDKHAQYASWGLKQRTFLSL